MELVSWLDSQSVSIKEVADISTIIATRVNVLKSLLLSHFPYAFFRRRIFFFTYGSF